MRIKVWVGEGNDYEQVVEQVVEIKNHGVTIEDYMEMCKNAAVAVGFDCKLVEEWFNYE